MLESRKKAEALVLIVALSFSAMLSSEESVFDDDIEALLAEKNRDYPGCVFIVRDELNYMDTEKRRYFARHLLDSCIKGRSIGEKRVQRMYDIDPSKDRPKKKAFNIRLAPLHEVNDEKNIFYEE